MNNQQIRAELTSARALVLPSFAEGLPVVLMEAMALGRPVISTFVAGIPELVDPTCGWLVPPGNAQALANAMQQALSADPAQLAKMGQSGSQRARERHDVAKEAQKLFSRLACNPCLSVGTTESPDTASKLAG